MLAALALVVLTLRGQEAEARPLALRGLDPVELVAGREVLGDAAHVHDRNGFRYAFASEESAETFEADPGRFEIQYGGGCGRMGPLSGSCSADRYLVHEGRIYIFASDPCRESFRKAPEAHIDQAEAPSADTAAQARGAELLAKVVEAVGGAEAVDSVRRVRLASGEDARAWREECDYSYGTAGSGATALARTSTQDGWSWREELDGMLRAGKAGGTLSPESWAARHEFELQLSRELVFLLRQRTNTYGFVAWSGGPVNAEGRKLESLVVSWNGRNTTLLVEPESGRVLRMRWRGRLETGPNGDVQVDFDSFAPAGSLTLPRVRHVRFDGEPVEQRSGALAVLEVE